MRVVILLLALLGAAGAGVGGVVWIFYFVGSQALVELGRHDTTLEPEDLQKVRAIADTSFQAIPFFFISAVLAVVGGIMAALGHTRSGGALLLTAALGPPVLAFNSPLMFEPVMLGGLSLLALGGVLGLVLPKPATDDGGGRAELVTE